MVEKCGGEEGGGVSTRKEGEGGKGREKIRMRESGKGERSANVWLDLGSRDL